MQINNCASYGLVGGLLTAHAELLLEPGPNKNHCEVLWEDGPAFKGRLGISPWGWKIPVQMRFSTWLSPQLETNKKRP